MIQVQLTQAVGEWPSGTQLGFDDLTHATAILGAGHFTQIWPVTPPTQQQLDAATQAAIAYNVAHRLILGQDFDPLVTGIGQLYNVKASPYNAKGDGTTDDTAAIQAAINAASTAGGGTVSFPIGTYKLTASLVLKPGVGLTGVYPRVTPTNSASWDLGFTIASGSILTYPGGVVFTQDTSAGTGTAGRLDGVIMERLGIDTAAGVLTSGAHNTTGLAGSVIRDVLVSNIAGVPFDLTNPMHIQMTNVKGSSVTQLLRVTSDYDLTVVNNQPGNAFFADLYAYVSAAGASLPTIHLRVLGSTNATSLNFCRFGGRIQINRMTFGTKTGNHILLEGVSASATVNAFELLGLDLEGFADAQVSGSYAYNGTIGYTGNASAAQTNATVRLRNSVYNQIDSQDSNFTLDMDNSASPTVLTGVTSGVTGTVYPLGVWYDKTKGGGAQIGVSRLGPVDGSGETVLKMPQEYLDFNTSGGGVRRRITNWGSTSQLTLNVATMGYVVVTTASGSVPITLPDATTCPRQEVTIKLTGAAATVTVSTQASQTIDGAATNTWLDTQYKYLTLMSNGANWLIVAKG